MKSVLRMLMPGCVAVAVGCAPTSAPPPPEPRQPAAPRPVAPPPPPPAANWQDMPLSPGTWVYSSQPASSQALFGPAASEAAFIVRCDRQRRVVELSREGTSAGPMTVRTSTGARNFQTSARTEPLAYVSTSVNPGDRFLDAIAFSRGRFTVEMPGAPMLVIPSWPEPARVVEDCRG